MNDGTVVLVGNCVSDPQMQVSKEGVSFTKLRMVVQPRKFDRASQRWVDCAASFYTVRVWRAAAENVAASIRQGDPILVTGRLRIREWEYEGRSGTIAEIDAQAIGHDLTRGRSMFARPKRAAPELPRLAQPPTVSDDPPVAA